MYSYTSISNGRHGAFSPPPLWNRISPCFCGIPFPHRRGFVLCFLRHPLPPPLRFVWFSNCACGPGGKENPPPTLWNRMVFPFAIHTHTHHVFVNVWPFYLLTSLLWNRMVFPFCSETHTHTHAERHTHPTCVCVCMAFSLRTCSSVKPPFHSLVCGPSGVRYGVRGPPGLETSGPCIWGGGLHDPGSRFGDPPNGIPPPHPPQAESV